VIHANPFTNKVRIDDALVFHLLVGSKKFFRYPWNKVCNG
jgi:hypothetical protein